MISPELLRRYAYFSSLTDAQLKALAMISEETNVPEGAVIIEADQPADALYLLTEGEASLYFVVTTPNDPYYNREYFISEINPGEIFGLSALLEPYRYSSRTRAGTKCRLVRMDARKLRELCAGDDKLAIALLTAVGRAAMDRLAHTRVQLIAAQSGR